MIVRIEYPSGLSQKIYKWKTRWKRWLRALLNQRENILMFCFAAWNSWYLKPRYNDIIMMVTVMMEMRRKKDGNDEDDDDEEDEE